MDFIISLCFFASIGAIIGIVFGEIIDRIPALKNIIDKIL